GATFGRRDFASVSRLVFFRLHRRRRDDRGDSEVFLTVRRLDAIGQLDRTDVDRIADLQPVERDVDLARDVGRVADDLELVDDDVEHAATLQAWRGVFIVEAHRDRAVQ